MDTALKVTLFIGCISGCFPVRNLHRSQNSFDCPVFFYCLLILMLYIFAETCSFLGQNEISTLQPSQLIVSYLVEVAEVVTCLTIRLWTLFRCSRITQLILQLIDLKKGTYHKPGPYIARYYFLGYLILLVDLLTFIYNQLYYNISVPEQNIGSWIIPNWLSDFMVFYKFTVLIITKYFALALVISMGVDVLHIFENFCYELQNLYCSQAVSNVHMIDDDYDSDAHEEDDEDEQVKKLDKKFMKDKSVMADFAAGLFGSWGVSSFETNVPSNRIVNHNSKSKVDVFQENKIFWMSTQNMREDKRIQFNLKDLSERFLEIQKCFDEFNKVAGLNFFILLSNSSIELIHKFYGVASGGDIRGNDPLRTLAKSFIAFLSIASLSHLGELISAKMRKWKEQLKCIMLTELLCDKFHDSTNTLTESVVKWDWNLSAMNLFNINHSTIPAIAGTMVTYLIVIIQLKVSENPATKTGPGSTTMAP